MASFLTGLAISLALKLAPPPAPVEWRPTAEALQAIAADPAPAEVTNGVHYLTSNERRLDLFLPELADKGGVHLGVGSDQNYILAGWSRPELMVIVDFDQQIVDLHAIYGALLSAAKTPARFLELWSPDGADDARAAIEAATEPGTRRRELLELYDAAREEVRKRNKVMLGKYAELGIHWYLEDADQYRRVRELHERGRVIAIRGDYTADGVVRRIGEILREQGHTVRVFYMSNIEQYLMYRKPFRANILGLPFDHRTLVLRTLPGRPAGFQYMLQRGNDFRAWLQADKVYSVYKIRGTKKGEHLVASEKFVIDALPPTTK